MAADTATASVLAFERKLDPSDALFAAGRWNDRDQGHAWPPVTVREKSVRGTISHHMDEEEADPAKLRQTLRNPNLQTVDVATLPPDADTLRVAFTLRVLGGAGTPSACDNAEYRKKLQEIVRGYVERHGFGELARRYAHNLANGRFLWRNRVGVEKVEVRIRRRKEGEEAPPWVFDGLKLSLREFPAEGDPALDELAQTIARGLAGEDYVFLEVEAYAWVGAGQEVFPSQELRPDKGSKNQNEDTASKDKTSSRAKVTPGQEAPNKSKTLYKVGEAEVAAMHSQKVGNALRTIDTWYPDEEGLGPIPVEPYGAVTSRGQIYRSRQGKLDFYSLLGKWMSGNEPVPEQQHFVMAVLIRGGVFGKSGRD